MICLPTSVEPVKQTLRTSGWVTNRSPTTEPLPGMTVKHALGQPGLERQLADPDRGQRGELGRLEHDGVAGGQRRREAPAGDRHREVPRHDDADHAERLVEGDVDAAGAPGSAGRTAARARRSSSSGTSRTLPASQRALPIVCPALRDLELGQLLDVRVDDGGERAQQPGPLAGRDVAPGREGLVRALDRGVGLRQRWPSATSVTASLGRRVDQTSWYIGRHILSKPRSSSQSVTAASKAASSTSAMFV